MDTAPNVVVVTDANVIINMIHVDGLGLLGNLSGYRFMVPAEVEAEIVLPVQSRALGAAFEADWIKRVMLQDLEALGDYADLVRVMGRGEAACIALAKQHGWSVATDEKGIVARAIAERLGAGRQLTTPGLLSTAIRGGLITVGQADQIKHELEKHKFKMSFKSFSDIIGSGCR